MAKRWLKKGKPLPDWVFASQDGTSLDEANLRHMFCRIIEKAGLRRIRFHDLRNTSATLLLLAGENPKVVSERLGHATFNVTLDCYSHVLPTMQKEAAAKLPG